MRALVIDDSRAMRTILTKMMEGFDFEVSTAADGREALDAMESTTAAGTTPDVCLVDWNMPVMNGLEFIVEVRKQPQWRNVTLMMVTTEAEQANIVRALAAGAHEYVIKPFTAETIESKLAMLGLI